MAANTRGDAANSSSTVAWFLSEITNIGPAGYKATVAATRPGSGSASNPNSRSNS